MGKYFVFKVNDGTDNCVRINRIPKGRISFEYVSVQSPNEATVWEDKKSAKSWEEVIKTKFKNAKLTECKLVFK